MNIEPLRFDLSRKADSKRLVAVLAIVLVAGCSTPVVMMKNDQTGQIERCGGRSTFAVRGPIGEPNGEVIPQDSDERCIANYEAKGFRRTSEAAEVMSRMAAKPPPAVTTAPSPARMGESKWLLNAEGVAKGNGCPAPTVALVGKEAGSELFAAQCQNGTAMTVRCEIEGCRVLR